MQQIFSYSNRRNWALVRVVLLLFLLLFWLGPAHASQPEETPKGHLVGFIYKADGETPLNDAQIVLEKIEKGKKTGETFESNITDETGEYKLENIPVGFYRGKILVKKKHYRIKRLDFFIHVIAGETNFLSFSLKKIKGRLS
ncbi:MAG: hypothetical protein GTO45_37230 [Candidatus Aminicenantes bacterium]|nr:hypothetical protein [Candidatus Aminicenantes bacterium]NIM84310.1 hypothetical protein [Candidatus Aminicenantes bacterium]NIN23796.1 hypothetical protein [Candidatus Aminicenantes bacterium]NIN47512.1 hypothetical protein [Candidatus Aminicenantes bacterium]NIN90432.1 hypothetical protein [Candidatus Aminicenantes bacterium]